MFKFNTLIIKSIEMKKYLYLVLLVLFCFSSCDDEKDCLIEKNNIGERYEELILKANSGESKIDALRLEMNAKLKNLDC
jgi:hypothetical protein